MNNLATIDADGHLELVANPTSIEGLLLAAVQQGATVDQLERLMALRQQMRAEAAKSAFDAAMARFQRDCPIIEKTKRVRFGNTDYSYAPLDKIIVSVRALLAECGLSYAIDVDTEGGAVTVICTAKHVDGHQQTSQMRVPLQDGKGMSEPQRFASAQTFAKRYAFCNAFGIMTGDEDDDNVSARTDLPEVPYSTPEERRQQRAAPVSPRQSEPASEAVKQVAAERTAAAKAAVADASGDTRKDVKLTMTGGGTTYTGDGGEKPCVVFKALHGSKEFTLRHWNPITFGERVAAAGDPENKLTPHKHEGPIIADLTAAPDGNGGYIYTCSNLRIVPAVAEVPAPELGEPISEDELAAMTAKGKK